MNILLSLTAYLPSIGGAQIHMHKLACELSKKHAIQVICQWNSNRTDWLLGTTIRAEGTSLDYVIDGIPVHRLGLTPRQ